jgi:hypothetical protein
MKATDKQIAFLKSLGYTKDTTELSKKEASGLIGWLLAQRQNHTNYGKNYTQPDSPGVDKAKPWARYDK